MRIPSVADLRSLTRPERRVYLAAAGGGVVLLGAMAFAIFGRGPASLPQPSTSPAAVATPTPEPTPFRPRATPPGTPAPRPSTFVLISATIPVSSKIPPAVVVAPSPEPGLWRLEGYVMDEAGNPIENVCVVIGPVGCQTYTTKTDERGHWFLDIASGPITPLTQVNFDFYFEIPGRETVWLRMTPQSSTVFNLVLRKT